MMNKIIAWTWLIWTILSFLYVLLEPTEYFYLTLTYGLGNIYIFVKYIESLKK